MCPDLYRSAHVSYSALTKIERYTDEKYVFQLTVTYHLNLVFISLFYMYVRHFADHEHIKGH